MSEGQSVISGQVVIVGGGVAGLEALIALRALVGDRVAVTLVSQDDAFVDRPLTVAEPFGLGSAARDGCCPSLTSGRAGRGCG